MATLNVTDFPSIDDALDAAEQAGANVGFPGGVYVTSGFRQRSGVRLVADGNVCIQWAGGPGTLASSAPDGVLADSGIVGIDLDARDADTAIAWRSALRCVLRDVAVESDNPAARVLDIDCNAAGATNRFGNRNAAYNRVDNLAQFGRCGSLVRLAGHDDGAGGPGAVTTLNSFSGLSASGVCGVGIDLASWCDSNQFDGITYLNLVGDGAVGIEANTAAPLTNLGVYANHFGQVAVDTWGVMTGRVGVRLNACHSIHIDHYANGPAAEGGQYQISPLASGYRIALLQETGGYQVIDPAWIAGYLFAFAVGAANQLVVDKVGNTIQRGLAQIGYGCGAESVGLEIGGGRTAGGYAYVDLVADPAWPDYGLRLIKAPGANGHAWLYHRGGGDLTLQAQDGTGRVVLAGSDGKAMVAVGPGKLGFNGKSPIAIPVVSGGTVRDDTLRMALHQLGCIIKA